MSNTFIEDIDRGYVSEYDAFLQAFDKKHPEKSLSQQKEIEKNQRIAIKRDRVVNSDNTDVI